MEFFNAEINNKLVVHMKTLETYEPCCKSYLGMKVFFYVIPRVM